MNGKTKLLAVGLTAVLVFGLVTAVNATEDEGEHGRRGLLKKAFKFGQKQGEHKANLLNDLGLSENATREEIRDAIWAKKLTDLGLTEDSTIGEYRDAMRAKMDEKHAEMLAQLGLDEDASIEELRDAKKAFCEENPDDCPRKRMGGFGRKLKKHMV